MALRNTSPCSKNSNSEEFDDMPIVPPKPIVQKEYKEEIPDISVISLISDIGPQLQRNFLRPQTGYNILPGNLNHISYQEQSEINLCVPKSVSHITEKSNGILDDAVSTFKPCTACDSCAPNQPVFANHRYYEHNVSNYRPPIPLGISKELSDRQTKCKSEDSKVIPSKACCKYLDSNVNASSNHQSGTCNYKQPPCTPNSNEPELLQLVNNPDCCCDQDQHYKLRKSLSEYERHENKLLCPVCFKKSCKCNFLGRKYNVNSFKNNDNCAVRTEKLPANTSDEISSIWEYLKRQEEKIDLIHKKVSNFLSQHTSCCIDQPTQSKELSNVTEHDIPYILSILGEHSDKITELQNEIKLLKLREHNFPPTNDNRIDKAIINQTEKINCVSIENCNKDIQCPSLHNEVSNEQRQKVTKVSTSTMTSFAIENDDKCVYHKQLTVVTDIRRERKSSSPKENDTLKPKNNLSGKKSNSQKRKSQKLDKSSPILKCKTNVSSNSSSDPHNTSDKQMVKMSRKSEMRAKRLSAENKVTDKRYLKDWGSDTDVEEQKNSATLKTCTRQSHSSKQRFKSSMSPKEVDTLKKRDSGNKDMNWETSSSSTDTEFTNPKHRQEIELDSEEEPSYLSLATVEYLNKYGLNHSGKNDRTKSSRKTTQSKRYL